MGCNPNLEQLHCYRPRSECYVFTGVCHSVTKRRAGGGSLTMDQVTTPPPQDGTRSQHLPLPPGWDQVTTPPPSVISTRSQHLPPPQGWDQVTTPPPPGWDQVTTPPRMGPGHNTSPPPPGLCRGGRYASYWNAFLFPMKMDSLASLLSYCNVDAECK